MSASSSRAASSAAIALILISTQPWFVWLSGTPMLEMYFLALFFLGLYFLTAWLKENRKHFWLYAGIAFMLASGFHYQCWLYIALLVPPLMAFSIRCLFTKRIKDALRITSLLAIASAFIDRIIPMTSIGRPRVDPNLATGTIALRIASGA